MEAVNQLTESYRHIFALPLEAWTNGRFRSTEHRAVANEKSDRISIAYFAFSQSIYVVSPRPECVDAEHPLRYRLFTTREYVTALMILGPGRDRGGFLETTFGIKA